MLLLKIKERAGKFFFSPPPALQDDDDPAKKQKLRSEICVR